MKSSFTEAIGLFIASILLVAVIAVIMAFPVQWLWNSCLVPAVEQVNPISFTQALGLNILCSILFKSSNTSKSNNG